MLMIYTKYYHHSIERMRMPRPLRIKYQTGLPELTFLEVFAGKAPSRHRHHTQILSSSEVSTTGNF